MSTNKLYPIYNRLLKTSFNKLIRYLPLSDILKLLLNFDNKLYGYISRCAIKYDDGLHPKHRLMAYHDYFVRNIGEQENVLDIGCGNGALSYDIARKTSGMVIGIDKSKDNIGYANKHYNRGNLKFVLGDVLSGLPNEHSKIKTVTMSNVIEHIQERVEFLKGVLNKIKPRQLLFRVPMFEREWMVPLKKELGVEYRLDQTHYIEYTQKDFFAELEAAGLRVESYEIRWGEIWAKAMPVK
jgi:2-polyprenyl-3-methyl-5-hydroxy-6-metoxy-1,4-benzoquinol methylase